MRPGLLARSRRRTAALSLCATLAAWGCVDEPEPSGVDQGVADMDADLPAMSAIASIQIVLDNMTPGRELTVRQGERLKLKVQAFSSSGELLVDNVLSRVTLTLEDMRPEGSSDAEVIARPALVLSHQVDTVEVLERGRARLSVAMADTSLRDSVILDATESSGELGALPRLTTLRRGEPLRIEASLTVRTPQGITPLLSLCTEPGEATAKGAIALRSLDPETGNTSSSLDFFPFYEVVGERVGQGVLEIACPALAQFGLPTSHTYHFRVDSAAEVTVGEEHTCALLRASSGDASTRSDLLCWGKNEHGQIGALVNGARQDVTRPTLVFRGDQDPIEVDAGARHTCAVIGGTTQEEGTRSGDLYCWGDDRFEQTAPIERENPDPSKPFKDIELASTPIPISLSYMRFARVCAGDQYSCALSDRGRLLCWGENSHGQLGERVPLGELSRAPVEIFPDRRYKEVACGGAHLCGTTLSGQSECWGDNSRGQLGSASPTSSPRPIRLESEGIVFDFELFSLGEATSCAIQNATLYCWGDNSKRQLTRFVSGERITQPSRVVLSDRPDERIESISIGPQHSCVLTRSDTLATEDEEACAVTHLDITHQDRPNQIVKQGTCADQSDANAATRQAWQTSKTPGTYDNCATTRLYCWGDNRWGQLAGSDIDFIDEPRQLSCFASPSSGIPSYKTYARGPGQTQLPFDDYRTVVAGAQHSCAAGRTTLGVRDPLDQTISVESKEKIWCWGRADNGKLGNGTSGLQRPEAASTFKRLAQSDAATPADTLTDSRGKPVGQWRELATGESHACVRTCLEGPTPNTPGDPTDDATVSCEQRFDAQHHLMCWGSNRYGQQGRVEGFDVQATSTSTRPNVFQISASTASRSHTLKRVVSGASHTCAVYQTFGRTDVEDDPISWSRTSDLRCWGYNSHQQAGAATGTSPYGNPNFGISGGADVACLVSNFGDKLGKLHTCGFTLIPDYGELFKPEYNTPPGEPGHDPLKYGYASERFMCWNPERMPTHPTNGLASLTFSARGQAYCWGNGNLGQQGVGESVVLDATPSPSVPVGGSSAYYNGIASSEFLNCGWRNVFATGLGELFCWGHDPTGLVKSWPAETPVADRIIYQPTKVEGWNVGTGREKLKSVVKMAMGRAHICVVSNTQQNYVICWGDNSYGQLGTPERDEASAKEFHLVEVMGNELTDVTQLVSGFDHTCALTQDQKLYCWGRNDRGQAGAFDALGNISDNLYKISQPYEITTFRGKTIRQLSAYGEHTCALVAESMFDDAAVSIHCWGANDLGQSACWDDRTRMGMPAAAGEPCTRSVEWARRPVITQAYP